MANSFRVVLLGEFLTQRKEFFIIDDSFKYKRARVQSHGQGIVLRDEVHGIEIKTKKQQAARAGEFLVAEIDAKVGGFGIVPLELESAVVSSHYFLYQIDEKKCSKEWLNWFVRYNSLEEQVKAQGSTNYAAIRPTDVLNFEIPLPSLAEQQRIVEYIELLVMQVDEAQLLREDVDEETNNLLIAMAHRLDMGKEKLLEEGWTEIRLGEVIQQVKDRHYVEPNKEYPNLGIYSFARGLFHKPPIDGSSTSANELYRVHKGQFIYSRLFAFEGACGFITDEYDGCYVSGEYPTFDCDPQKVMPGFLFAYFKSLSTWKEISAGSKGLGDRRQRVQAEKFLEHRLLLPTLEWQSKIAAVMQKVESLRGLQSETQKELDGLLPSILDKAFKGEL